ncbi:hypothetical protein EK904_014090, partial [Melospiza melodia maxima]
VPRRCPVVTKSIPEVHLAVPGPGGAVPAADPVLEEKLHSAGDTRQPLPLSAGGIHVYAHQRRGQTARAVPGSQEVCEVLEGRKGEREHNVHGFQLNSWSPKDAEEQFFPLASSLPSQRDPVLKCADLKPRFAQGLVPDPILKLRTIIGFGGCSTKWVSGLGELGS